MMMMMMIVSSWWSASQPGRCFPKSLYSCVSKTCNGQNVPKHGTLNTLRMTLPLPTPDDLDFNEAGHIMLPETLQHQPGIIRTSTGTWDQQLVIDISVRTLLGWNGHCLGMLSWHICQHLTLPASPGRELLQSCCACTSSPPSSNWNSSNMEKHRWNKWILLYILEDPWVF